MEACETFMVVTSVYISLTYAFSLSNSVQTNLDQCLIAAETTGILWWRVIASCQLMGVGITRGPMIRCYYDT